MASDTSIYGLLRQPEPIQGPMDQYGKAIQLKGLIGQTQLQGLQRQQLQQNLTDTQNVRNLLASNPNASPAQVMQASPQFGLQYQKTQLENEQSKANIQKITTETHVAKVKALKDSLASVNDQQSFDAWKQINQADLQQYGMPVPDQFSPDWQKRAILDGEKFLAQNTMTPYQKESLRLKKLEVDPFGMLGGGGAAGTKPGTPQQPGLTGEDFLKSMDPSMASQVKAYAEGRMAFPAGFALKSPYFQNMLRMVGQYDPNFDAVNYNARAKTRADFTSGKSAQSVGALNTVIGHLDTLSNSVDKLDNTAIPAYNTLKNYLATATGDPKVKEFNNTKKAVTDELTRVWRGTGGAEADIKTWGQTLEQADSPAQLHGVIKNIGDLLHSRIEALNQQYNKGMGVAQSGLNLLNPGSQQVLDRLSAKAEGNSAGSVSSGQIKFLGFE